MQKQSGHLTSAHFSPDVEQRLSFVHLYITDGTVFAGFQVAHNAHLADYKWGEKMSNILSISHFRERWKKRERESVSFCLQE